MRPFLRTTLSILLLLAWSIARTQNADSTSSERQRPRRIEASDLRENGIALPGYGQEIPGIDLGKVGRPRVSFRDDNTFSARVFDDEDWPALRSVEDSLVQGVHTYWVRYHLAPDADLEEEPLILNLGGYAPAEIFLNGRAIMSAGQMPHYLQDAGMPLTDTVPHVSIPIVFACDGAPEVIALRVHHVAGSTLGTAAVELTLHAPDMVYGTQRTALHFGLFVGVNLIILVLSVVLWFQDKRDTSWLLLALLALIEAFDSVMDIAGDQGLLGFPEEVSRVLNAVATMLRPWPLYLLILVLRKLRGDLDHRSARRYAWAVAFLTIIYSAWALGQWLGPNAIKPWVGSDLDASPIIVILIVGVVIALLLMGVVIAWFAVEVVRLAIRLLRTKGYEQWVGGGALVSCVLTLILALFDGNGTMGSALGLASNYCDHVAVPLSVAIYLAIRSAHHNKAVARQRDDLDREVQERTAELSLAKKRSDDLLLNILPHEVAEELKQTGSAAAKHFDQATVMFTDFKGFTAMSERVAPGELLDELNTCFRAFDGIIARHGIEKIKTIGDAYMCASGLPDPNTSSPAAVVHAALEMQDFMHARQVERETRGQLAFIMRLGIHTGPVVAGIVGVKKFQYDIWGDTVNTASRMESSGEVGQVNISEATYLLVKDDPRLAFTPRGKVGVKGKGDMDMYFARHAPGTRV